MIILNTLESQNRRACYWHQLPLMGPAYWRPLLVSTAPPQDSPQDHTFEENTQREKHTVPPQDHRCFNFPLPLVCVPSPPPPFSMEDPFKIDKKCHKIEGELNRCLGNGVGLPLEQTISRLLQVPRACLPAQWEGPCLTMHSIICTALHCTALH